jgi:transcriptional regulator with XRE-family HTH domain
MLGFSGMKELGQSLRELRRKAWVTLEEEARGHQRVTQELLAERLGWSNAAHISQIEHGSRMPQVDTLQRWVSACGGTDFEIYYLLGLAGYLPLTQLPPKEQCIAALNNIDLKSLQNYPYPAYVVDYRATLWMVNSVFAMFLDEQTTMQHLFSLPINVFQLTMDPRLPIRHKLLQPETLYPVEILSFKMHNMMRQHEPFYKRFVENTAKGLLPEQAAELKRIWDETPLSTSNGFTVTREEMDFLITPDLTVTLNGYGEMVFNMRDLFVIGRFEPNKARTSPQDLQALEALCEPLRGKPSAKLWEHTDVDVYLRQSNQS